MEQASKQVRQVEWTKKEWKDDKEGKEGKEEGRGEQCTVPAIGTANQTTAAAAKAVKVGNILQSIIIRRHRRTNRFSQSFARGNGNEMKKKKNERKRD